MKIERLDVTNYRSWGRLSLDLAGVTGAVITGGNGLGKSSLLEAILWCLFGKSRSAGADGIVRIGAESATVEVVVAVAKGRFRVRRHRSLKGNGKTTVALERWSGETWEAVGGAGKRGTDEAIVEALGIDHETLLATSVAVQGDAGRFTRAQPAERRALLATLLDLDLWAEDATAARAKATAAKARAEAAETRVRLTAGADLEAAELAAADATAARTQAHAAVVEASERSRAADGALSEARVQAQQAERVAELAEGRRAEASRLTQQALDAQARAQALSSLRDRLAKAAAAAERLPHARTALSAFEEALASARQAATDRATCLAALDRARAEAEGLTAQVAQVRGQIGDVSTLEARAADLQAARADLAQALTALERVTAEGLALKPRREALANAPQAVATAQAYRARFTAELAAAEAEAKALRAQAALIGEVPCGGAAVWLDPTEPGGRGACNLSGSCQLLASARDAAERLSWLEDVDLPGQRAAVDKAAAELAAAEAEATELAELNRQRDALLADHQAAAAAKASAEGRVQAAEHAAERLAVVEALRTTLADLERREADAQAKARNLAAAVPPAPDVAGLEAQARSAATEVRDLDAAAVHREALEPQIAAAEAAGRDAQALLAQATEARAQADAYAAQAAGAPQALAEAHRLASEAVAARMAAEAELSKAQEAQARAQALVERARVVAEASDRAAAEATEERADAEAWTQTAKVCALAPTLKLEAMALPALEREANRALERLSSRGLRLELRTQRALKSADHQRETLDIVVVDHAGQRLYEDLSGGEQFRVDLALRLALGRLLAAKAGAQVDLLVIDEGGFGALDPEGIEACRETLGRLDAFGQVLVVTHIEALANALPRRIVVSAGPDGSVAEVV